MLVVIPPFRGLVGGGGSSFRSSCFHHQQLQIMNKKKEGIILHHHHQPWLMLSSPTKPQSRLFFDIQEDQGEERKQILRLNREIHLPDISGHQCIGSSEGFLITYDHDISRHYHPQLHATHPLTGAHLPPFPSLSAISRRLPRFASSRDYQPPPLANSYHFLFRSKAVLSPSLDTVALLHGECFLAFARLTGSSTDEWHPNNSVYYSQDCIFHEGLLHCVDDGGALSILNLNDPSTLLFDGTHIRSLEQEPVCSSLKKFYIVESPDGDDLFVVYRQQYCCIEDGDDDPSLPQSRSKLFKVFKFDKKKNYKLDQVDRVGDFAIFVGPNQSTALSVHDFPTLKPNSIYFTDDFRDDYCHHPEMIGDTGVFNLEDGSIHFFPLTTDDGQLKLNHLPPVWFIPPKLSASSEVENREWLSKPTTPTIEVSSVM